MGDIFTSSDAQNLLLHKHVVILGDSNFRSIYKDVISLLQSTKFMNTRSQICENLLNKSDRQTTMHPFCFSYVTGKQTNKRTDGQTEKSSIQSKFNIFDKYLPLFSQIFLFFGYFSTDGQSLL